MKAGVVVLIIALAGCAGPPKLAAPRDSYTPGSFKVTIDGADETVQGSTVTAPFFAAEQVQPLLGRFFIANAEYQPQLPGLNVAVLSHRYWVERFKSAPTVIGSKVVVDGRPRVIVGVAPPTFDPEGAGLIWIPKT